MTGAEKPLVLALVGPTASGKTSLSLALANNLPLEVVACDSRTVYREFDIGTAKPSRQEMAACPHHMIDVVDPGCDYTVATYTQDAGQSIASIIAGGRVPLVCGGTGFWSKALLGDLDIPPVAPDQELRARLNQFADENGNQALHERLRQVDEASAAKLGVNDRFRIIRALEVYEILGQPMSQAKSRKESPYRVIWLGLNAHNRQVLYDVIKARFAVQLEQGLHAEVESLYRKYGASQKLLHTVNYKELVQMLEGQVDRAEAERLAIRHNCDLARRQLMWFRANSAIKWFFIDEENARPLPDRILRYLQETAPGLVR